MTIKYTFARNTDTNAIDFSERAMARAVEAMSREPYLPKSVKDAIDRELLKLTRDLAHRNPDWHSGPEAKSQIHFEAVKQVMEDHPNLLRLSRKCVPVPDDDYLAEARIEAEDEGSVGRSRLRAI